MFAVFHSVNILTPNLIECGVGKRCTKWALEGRCEPVQTGINTPLAGIINNKSLLSLLGQLTFPRPVQNYSFY